MRDLSRFKGKRLYLDANVFIYAVEGFQPHDATLAELFTLIEQRKLQVTTSEITLAEVLVLPLRENRPELARMYEQLLAADGPIDVVPINRDILRQTARVRAHSSTKPFDAIHIATAIATASTFFLSEDRRLNPAPVSKLTIGELTDG